MKERFVSSSSQYLNRERGKPGPPGEVLPFPNRPEYEGIFLAHDLFNSAILEPVLNPVAEELSERISTLLNSGPAIRRIRRVFYVGGTNIDGFVRRRFRGIFPGAPAEQESSAPLADQIQERLSAVVDGAIWRDEGLYAASPVTLTLVMHGTELAVVQAGAPLLPAGLATVLSSTALLEPGEELDAQLLAETGPTAGRICIARGFHRNATDAPREVTLQVAISREKGAVGTLIVGNYREDQWQVALVDAGK
jgi:hypothetical protein